MNIIYFRKKWEWGLRVNIQNKKIQNKKDENFLILQEVGNFFTTLISSNNITSVIVRPDRYVYAIANNKSDLKNILKDFNYYLN